MHLNPLIDKQQVIKNIFSNLQYIRYTDFRVGETYRFVIPFARKQFDAQFDKEQAYTESKERFWYVILKGYFEQEHELGDAGSESVYYIRPRAPVLVSFRGHGFFLKLQSCNRKDASVEQMTDADALVLHFQKRKDKNGSLARSWDLLKMTTIPYEQIPDNVKHEEDTYGQQLHKR